MAAKVTMPTHRSEPVSVLARAPRATINAQAEDWEHMVAIHSLR